jgi:hypothetical protein
MRRTISVGQGGRLYGPNGELNRDKLHCPHPWPALRFTGCWPDGSATALCTVCRTTVTIPALGNHAETVAADGAAGHAEGESGSARGTR